MKIIIRMLLKGIEQWLFTTLLAAHKSLCNETHIHDTGSNVNKDSMIFTLSFMKPHINGIWHSLPVLGSPLFPHSKTQLTCDAAWRADCNLIALVRSFSVLCDNPEIVWVCVAKLQCKENRRRKAFTATKRDSIFSGNQPLRFGSEVKCFGDLLYLHHNHFLTRRFCHTGLSNRCFENVSEFPWLSLISLDDI
jgi:hypothetical protein